MGLWFVYCFGVFVDCCLLAVYFVYLDCVNLMSVLFLFCFMVVLLLLAVRSVVWFVCCVGLC